MSWSAIGWGTLFGSVGGLAALVIRLKTPGEPFYAPPTEQLDKFWRTLLNGLAYTSDITLGAIAGAAAVGIGGISSDPIGTLVATAIAAGVGGSGFLVTLGNKAQAEAKNAALVEHANGVARQSTNLQTVVNSLNEKRNQDKPLDNEDMQILTGHIEQLGAAMGERTGQREHSP
jgi:hypothetical protein